MVLNNIDFLLKVVKQDLEELNFVVTKTNLHEFSKEYVCHVRVFADNDYMSDNYHRLYFVLSIDKPKNMYCIFGRIHSPERKTFEDLIYIYSPIASLCSSSLIDLLKTFSNSLKTIPA